LARLLFQKSGDKIPWLGKLGWWLEAAILKLFWKWVSASTVERASARGYRLFRWLGPRLNKNRHVMGNLGIAFPGMSQAEYEALAEAVWGNIGAVLAEYPFLKTLVATGPDSHTTIEMRGVSKTVVENRESAVYVTPHLGNWEIAAATVAKLEIPLSTIYSPQSNPGVDRMILGVRESLGLKFVPKEHAVRQLLKELRQGRSVGMLPDQRVDEGDLIPTPMPMDIGMPMTTREEAVRALCWYRSHFSTETPYNIACGEVLHELTLKIAKQWKADGGMLHQNIGCTMQALGSLESRNAVAEAGIPCINYEGNDADVRDIDMTNMKRKFDIFFEANGVKRLTKKNK